MMLRFVGNVVLVCGVLTVAAADWISGIGVLSLLCWVDRWPVEKSRGFGTGGM
jgi:hypothetical protein